MVAAHFAVMYLEFGVHFVEKLKSSTLELNLTFRIFLKIPGVYSLFFISVNLVLEWVFIWANQQWRYNVQVEEKWVAITLYTKKKSFNENFGNWLFLWRFLNKKNFSGQKYGFKPNLINFFGTRTLFDWSKLFF